MNDREKLDKINEISNNIWDWMCNIASPVLIELIPVIEQIREISQPLEDSAK